MGVTYAAAPEGPGGLGTEYSPEVGINSRRAREESLNVQTAGTRFVRTSVGGLPSVSTAAVVSREPFVNRSARLSGDQPGSGRGATSPQTNAAIEAGLAFLARHQHPDGHWSLQGFDDATNSVSEDERRFMLVSDTGAALSSIGQLIVSINDHVGAIAISAREQSTGLAEINTAVNHMDQSTQQNAAMVEETSAASTALAHEAARLRDLVVQFSLESPGAAARNRYAA